MDKQISSRLFDDIMKALESLGGWGSVEVFVQDNKVTQISRRAIKKTAHSLKNNS